MTTLENAARQALEKMEYMMSHGEWYEPEQAIKALRKALEQPSQKPVAWIYDKKTEGVTVTDWLTSNYNEAHSPTMEGTNIRPLYTAPLQPLAVERERNFCERCGKRLGGADRIHTCTPPQPAPQSAIEQQPVAWISGKSLAEIKDFDATVYGRGGFDDATPLYTEPPKREWVGLTDVEMTDVANTAETYTESVKLTEAKLKEKNT